MAVRGVPEGAASTGAALRGLREGTVAAAVALVAMAGTAAAGLLLLDAGRVGRLDRLTAAVVAMAAGAPAGIDAAPDGGLPVAVHGRVDVMPLGVSAVGAIVLGFMLLRRGRDGWLVRGASAAVVFAAGMGAVAWAARGPLALPTGGASPAVEARGCPGAGGLPGGLPGGLSGGLPGAFDAGFAVAVGPAMAGAAVGALVVAALCRLSPPGTAALRAMRWPAVVVAAVCVLSAGAFGGPAAAGAALLAWPIVAVGGPWTWHAEGVLSCALNGGPPLPGALLLVCATVALTCGAALAAGGGQPRRATAAAVRTAAVTGVLMAVLALLARASAELSAQAFVFSLPLLEVRLTANPWPALAAGAAGGLAGSLLVGALRRRGFGGGRP
ncbi:hypothetical protein Ade02nite_84220 [Paractinoplanes deccanensis]|uniref:Uncharacterized protein n=1 Tax=Paractinoplanes deccanensis TaxID=113561 RepID=A0ABQ3YIE9_9ACTN|nr:hypothetical protein [Actinoplanes deccanensis]GID79781.1 hypothetical protein Ade02nite_84220 [Actinoplanes deccanensis]